MEVVGAVSRRAAKNADLVLLTLNGARDLGRIATLKTSLTANGALWTIRPKGHAEVSEQRVRQAGRAAGLVDVKVVAFSATHTAEKFVIPKRDRRNLKN